MFKNSKLKKKNKLDFRLRNVEKNLNELKNYVTLLDLRIREMEANFKDLKQDIQNFAKKFVQH